MTNILHSYIPNPTAFSLGPISIHWYGLLLALGIIVGYWLVSRLAKVRAMSAELMASIYVNLLIWGIIGARLYHVFVIDFKFYWSSPNQILAIWNGGLAIHGAIIAGIAVLIYYATLSVAVRNAERSAKKNFLRLADLFVIPVILGQAIGRWGNYFNQELFGKPTESWIGIPIDVAHRPLEYIQHTHFQPAFLYESIWNFAVFGALYVIYKKEKRPGVVFWLYIALYSLGRAVLEFVRIDSPPEIFGIRLPLALSAVLAAVGVFMIVKKIRLVAGNSL